MKQPNQKTELHLIKDGLIIFVKILCVEDLYEFYTLTSQTSETPNKNLQETIQTLLKYPTPPSHNALSKHNHEMCYEIQNPLIFSMKIFLHEQRKLTNLSPC